MSKKLRLGQMAKKKTSPKAKSDTKKLSPMKDGMTERQRMKLELFLKKHNANKAKLEAPDKGQEEEEKKADVKKRKKGGMLGRDKREIEAKQVGEKRKNAASIKAKANAKKAKPSENVINIVVMDNSDDEQGGADSDDEASTSSEGQTVLVSDLEDSKRIGAVVLIASAANEASPATFVVRSIRGSWVKLEDKFGIEHKKSYRAKDLVVIGTKAEWEEEDEEEEEWEEEEEDDEELYESDEEADDDISFVPNSSTRKKKHKKESESWVRRSVRQPGEDALSNPSLLELLERLTLDDQSLAILKLKKFIGMDSNQIVIDAILEALMFNTSVQALYIQNFNVGMKDNQVFKLIDVLKRGYIWTLNIGETYNVRPETWGLFTEQLTHTNVTHMYASEHTMSKSCKLKIMETMRFNRKKHSMHCDPDNLDVIKGVTHCWWNPINAKILRPYLIEGEELLLGTDKTKTVKDLEV
jgi:hypothetical protein